MAFDRPQDLPRYSGPVNFSPQKIYDVAVIGAGPGGSAAAGGLARRGFSVLILEKAALPRYKTCGGGLLHRVRRQMPDEVAAVVERECHAITLNFLAAKLSYTATRAEPIVSMTMRAELDQVLVRAAQKLGAELIESCLVKNVLQREEFVEIATEQQSFRARFVIGADGVHSLTAKTNGWSPLPRLAPALEWELQLSPEDFARFGHTARFDFDCIDSGYAWVFPKRDHVSVGILGTSRTNQNLPAKLENYLAAIGIAQILKAEKHGYLIPLAPRREPLARGRVLLVGDAAGLADPITAEGISYAWQSGQLAAEVLAVSRLDVSIAAARYQTLLEKDILRDLRAGRFLAKVLYEYPSLRTAAFRWQGRQLTEFVAAVVMGERGYADALKSPASWWKMLAGKTWRQASRLP